MQEYGALLRNTFKNPFDDFNASLIDTDKIVRFWCDPTDKGPKELLSASVFFTQKMPFIIQGSRGSGKTMLFKYYSYDAQKIVAKEYGSIISHLRKCGGVGFYFRCDPPFINSLKAVCADSSLEEWEDVFSYYMQMHISQSIINMILDLEAEGELSSDKFEQKILGEISAVYAIEPFKSFKDLYTSVVKEIKAIQDYKNLSIFFDDDIKIARKFSPFSLAEVLIDSIRKSVQELSSINYVLMVDEYEALPPELQRSFNTMLKYANDKLTLRIGRRTERNIETATINDTEYLRINNDYLLVDLDENMRTGDPKKYFYSVAQKRIDLVFKDVSVDVKRLFGSTEDLLEECKNNAGSRKEHIRQILKTDTALSGEQINAIISIIEAPDNPIMEMLNALWVIRNPDKDKLKIARDVQQVMWDYLNKCHTLESQKYKLDYENKYRYTLTVLLCSIYKKNKMYYSFNTIVHLANGNTRVFINLCREIISDALFYEPDAFFDNLSVSALTQSNAIHKFSAKEFDDICSIIQYGESIRKLILNLGNMFAEFHKDRRARYPETNQFVLDKLELEEMNSTTLNMALRWSMIVKKPTPQRLSVDINKRGDIFYIDRIFSPLFNISYRTRGGFNVSIEKEEFSKMCEGIFTPSAVGKVLGTKKEESAEQLSLFGEIGDGSC